jgi:hypothetical protein
MSFLSPHDPAFLGRFEDHLRPGQCRRWLVDAGHIGVFAGRHALATAWPEIAASWCEGNSTVG